MTAGTNITIDANNVISAAAAEDELPTIASGDAGKVLTVNSGENGVEWTTPSGSATVVGYEADSNMKIRIGSGNSQTQAGYIIGLNNSVKSTGGVPVVIGKDNHTLSGAANSVVMGTGNYVSASGVVVAGQSIELPNNFYGTTVVGRYNNKNELASQAYPFVVGTGTSYSNLKNGLILDGNANLTVLGKMTVGAAPTNDMDVATKKYVDDNAGGGGSATYIAGKGIEIDANNTISTVSNNPLIYSMLLMTTSGNLNNMPNVVSLGASSTWDDFVNNIKQGKVVYITTSTSYTFSESYKLTPALLGISTLYAMNLDAISIPSMGASVSSYPSTGTQVYFTTFYYFDGAFLWSWTKPEQLGNFIKVHYKNYNNYALGRALQDINTDITAKQDALPAAPAADGTYFLSTTVSSGTATQSWVSIPAANGNNF